MLRELLNLQDPCLAGRIKVETRLAFTERLPGTPIPYSDHKAVRAELRPGVMSLA